MKHIEILNKTLQEIEGQDWGEPTYNSHLVVNCHRLRRVPLKDFTVEDLRLMIGQKIGLRYLVPIAIKVLQDNPLVAGDMYEGDLLNNVLRLPEQFWSQHPVLKQEMNVVAQEAIAQIDILGATTSHSSAQLRQDLER